MTITANFPKVRPTLSLDFANSRQLDHRVTFTRSTTATYYDGVTNALAEQNLVIRSQGTGMAAGWGADSGAQSTRVDNAAVAPDGTTTAMSFTSLGGFANMSQSVSTIAGSTYTLSFYAQVPSGTYTFSGGSAGITGTITTAWQRFTVTGTISTSSTVYLFNSVPITQVIYVWGVQLEMRGFAGVYTPTTTAAITNYIPQLLTAPVNQPRFDANPTTGASLGLLMEQSSTNLTTYGGAIGGTGWTLSNTTANTTANISPDGTLNASKITETTANANHRTQTTATVTTTTYSFSVYAKAAERANIVLLMVSAPGYITQNFNLSTGLIKSTSSSGTQITAGTPIITSVGNGWYRCTMVGTVVSGTSLTYGFDIAQDDTTNTSYAGNSSYGIYVWGAQLEALAFPTSYIPTVASQVTRAQDFATMTGTNFSSWFNNNQGTVYCSFDTPTLTGGVAYWGIDNGASNGYLLWRVNASMQIYSAWSTVATIGTVSAINTTQQTTFSYNNISPLASAGSLNGATAVSVSSPTQLAYIATQMAIGRNGVGNPMTGHIRKFAYYPVAVTSDQLQALTGS